MKNKGFTLIELVLIIGLLVLTVGVSGDIIITLIRSYNKTQVMNEIEQSADFVLLKLEKELRSSEAVSSTNTTLDFTDKFGRPVTYRVLDNVISRDYDDEGFTALTDSTFLGGGVSITCPSNVCFLVSGSPEGSQAVRITIDFSQSAEATNLRIFEGEVSIDTTIVARGTYQ